MILRTERLLFSGCYGWREVAGSWPEREVGLLQETPHQEPFGTSETKHKRKGNRKGTLQRPDFQGRAARGWLSDEQAIPALSKYLSLSTSVRHAPGC